jgi:hypothetical protein
MSIAGLGSAAAVVATFATMSLAGCDIDLGRSEFRDTYRMPVAVSEIQITGGSGDVSVRPGPPGQVEVSRVVSYWRDAPTELQHRIAGTVLHASTECGNNCSISYVISAPRGVRVSGHNDSGNLDVVGVSTVEFTVGSGEVTVKEATGSVQVTADSGNITLAAVSGTVSTRTGSGDIDALDLRSDSVTANADSGNITLVLATPTGVRVQTGSGNIELRVPAGDYQVDAQAGSGDVNVEVANRPGGANLLHLRADSGNITVSPA